MHGFSIDQSIIITFPLFIDSSTKYRLENQSFNGRHWCDRWFTWLDHFYETFLEILIPQYKGSLSNDVGKEKS